MSRELGSVLLIRDGASLAYVKDPGGHRSIQITVDTYGHLIPQADIAWVDRQDLKTTPQQNATPAQPEQLMSEAEIPQEVVDLIGGPTRIRTWNQQIMSPNRDNEPEEDKGVNPANSSKVLQNPQPRRNKIRKHHDE
jgi:hypothetical protein